MYWLVFAKALDECLPICVIVKFSPFFQGHLYLDFNSIAHICLHFHLECFVSQTLPFIPYFAYLISQLILELIHSTITYWPQSHTRYSAHLFNPNYNAWFHKNICQVVDMQHFEAHFAAEFRSRISVFGFPHWDPLKWQNRMQSPRARNKISGSIFPNWIYTWDCLHLKANQFRIQSLFT